MMKGWKEGEGVLGISGKGHGMKDKEGGEFMKDTGDERGGKTRRGEGRGVVGWRGGGGQKRRNVTCEDRLVWLVGQSVRERVDERVEVGWLVGRLVVVAAA